MLYFVRGKTSSKEQVLLIDADSPKAAEAEGWKRGLFVTSVTEKKPCGLTPAWLAPTVKKLWSLRPVPPLTCFGRPVNAPQTAALLMLGVIVGLLNLHVASVI